MSFFSKITLLRFLAIIAISILAVRCAPEKRFQVLSFFFDGVPEPERQAESVVISSDPLSDVALTAAATNAKPSSYLHKPFEEEKCKSCHAEGFSNSLLIPAPELCYTCHEDFNSKFQSLHGPVVAGYCTACHDQHEAKYEKLLRAEGQQLCYSCHEPKQVLSNKKHEKIGEKNCTECHNPHGGENRGLLKQGICYNCHDDFNTKFNFLHGPAASGNCAACHGSHGSNTAKLLLRESQQICLFCHDANQVFKNTAHQKAKKSNCTECHNPHGGEDRFVLKESIRPFTPIKFLTKKHNDSLAKLFPSLTRIKDSLLKNSAGVEIPNENIVGNLMYGENNPKPLTNTEVNLINEKGETVLTTYTNENGSFTFKNLPGDQIFIIKTNENATQLSGDTKIMFARQNGKEVQTTRTGSKGGFEFSILPADHKTLSITDTKIDTNDVCIAGNLLFGETNPKPLANTKVNIVNEKEEIIQTAYTSDSGTFAFTNLPAGKNLMVRVDENDVKLEPNTKIELTDKTGVEKQTTLSGSKGGFKFLLLATESNTLAEISPANDVTIAGKLFVEHDSSKVLSNTIVNLVNEKGEIVKTDTTDATGFFEFTHLPTDQKYLVQVDEVDTKIAPNERISAANKKGKEMPISTTGNSGTFRFSFLAYDYTSAKSMPIAELMNYKDESLQKPLKVIEKDSILKSTLVSTENTTQKRNEKEKEKEKEKEIEKVNVNTTPNLTSAENNWKVPLQKTAKDSIPATTVLSVDRKAPDVKEDTIKLDWEVPVSKTSGTVKQNSNVADDRTKEKDKTLPAVKITPKESNVNNKPANQNVNAIGNRINKKDQNVSVAKVNVEENKEKTSSIVNAELPVGSSIPKVKEKEEKVQVNWWNWSWTNDNYATDWVRIKKKKQ